MVEFTGEFIVPGEVEDRLIDDHYARYRYARRYASGANILDIACGYGYGAEILSSAPISSYLGVDINEELVCNARQVYEENSKKVLSFECADATTWKSDRKFDLVISFETVEHIPNYQDLLRNLREKVRPGGRLLISSPNRPVTSPQAPSIFDKPANEFHTQEFTINELLLELKHAGFSFSDVSILGQRLSFCHFKNRALVTLRDYARLSPDFVASPELKKFKFRTPKYFIIDAVIS